MIFSICNNRQNEKFVDDFVKIQTHKNEFILCVLLSCVLRLYVKLFEREHELRFVCAASIIHWRSVNLSRSLHVYDRFVVSDFVQIFLFLRFDIALKASRWVFLVAVDALFVIVYRFVFVEEIFMRTKFAFYIVASDFSDVIVFLTVKVLLNSAFFFEIFANSMWIIVENVVSDLTIRRRCVDEFDNQRSVFLSRFFRFFCSCDFDYVHFFM